MKDHLLEELMHLFDTQLTKRDKKISASSSNNELIIPENWAKVSNLEQHTHYIRASSGLARRVFNIEEQRRFTKKAFQFIEQMVQLEIFEERTFELVINQLLFSESDFVALQEVKWTIYQTLEGSLTKNQQTFLNTILFSQEANMTKH